MDSDCQYVGGSNYANLLTIYNIMVFVLVLIVINIF